MWKFGPRRWVVERLVAEAAKANAEQDDPQPPAAAPTVVAYPWAQRIDDHRRPRSPRSVSASWLAEAQALRHTNE